MTLYTSNYRQSMHVEWVCATVSLCLSTSFMMYVVLCVTRANFNVIVLFGSLMLHLVDWLFYAIFNAIMHTITDDEPIKITITYGLQLSWTILVFTTNIIVMVVGLIMNGFDHAITDEQQRIVLFTTAILPTGLSIVVITTYYMSVLLERCGQTLQKLIRCLYN